MSDQWRPGDDDQAEPEIAGERATPEDVTARSTPSRLALTFAVAPLIGLTVLGYATFGLRAELIANHPHWLLILDPRTLHMVVASSRVALVTFFAIVIVRRLMFDPCYFTLGRWYGDSAVAWLGKRSPELGELAVTIERWFPRWGPLIVIVYPHPLVMVLAGASKMRFAVFMTYDLLGTIAVAVLVRVFEKQLEPVVQPVTGFMSRYTWPLVIASFALLAFYGLRAQREGGKMTSIGDIERQLKGDRDDK